MSFYIQFENKKLSWWERVRLYFIKPICIIDHEMGYRMTHKVMGGKIYVLSQERIGTPENELHYLSLEQTQIH